MKKIIFLLFLFISILNLSCKHGFDNKLNSSIFYSNEYKKLPSNNKLIFLNSLNYRKDTKDTVEINFILNLSSEYYYLNEFEKSIKLAKEALDLYKGIDDIINVPKSNLYLGDYYSKVNKLDSSFFYYKNAEKKYQEINDNEMLAKVHFKKAYILFYEGDFIECEIQVSKSLKLLKKSKDFKLIFSAYSLMGANFEKLEEYKKSLYYFQKAKVILKNNKLYFDRKYNYLTSISDNLSIVYVKLGMFQEALDELKSINLNKIINECPNDYAAVAGNLGMVYLKIGRKHKAKKYFLEALNTAKREKNLNTEMYQYINLGEYYLKYKVYNSSICYFDKALIISRLLKSTDEYKLILRYLTQVDSKNKNYYNEHYIVVSDSLFKAQRKSRDKYARIEYETSVVEDENKLLSTKNTYILIGSIQLIFLLVLVIVYRYIKSQKREIAFTKAQQKAEEEIFDLLKEYQLKLRIAKELEQNRISKELHDSVMNKLYGARIQLGILNDSDDKEIKEKRLIYVDLLQEIEQEIRTISHDLQSEVIDNKFDYVSILFNLIQLQNEIGATLFSIEVDSKIDWNTIDSLVKITIFRIVQESLLNVTKHAKAKECKVSLSLESNHLILHIKDDGVGFDVTSNSSGIGLKNMKERISALNSKFEIFSDEKKGTLIKVVIFF